MGRRQDPATDGPRTAEDVAPARGIIQPSGVDRFASDQLPSGAPIAVSPGEAQTAALHGAPLYRTKGVFFDGQRLHDDGVEIVHHGEPGENLEPLNAHAHKAHRSATAKPQSQVPGMLAYTGSGSDQKPAGAQAGAQTDTSKTEALEAQVKDLTERLAALEKPAELPPIEPPPPPT